MGTVYTALQRPVDRKVALKIIHRELAGNPEIVARFLEEMRLTATIEHPHTVRVYDFGDIDGQPFLTTEFLDGRSLRDELLRPAPSPSSGWPRCAPRSPRPCGPPTARGVVHRDLKPENIMLLDLDGDTDYVKVLDFGIARSLHRTTGMRTGTGALLGTPAYMSPEQCEGKPVDGRSDLYALGLVAYELSSGALPFPPSESLPQMLLSHVATPPPDLKGPRAPAERGHGRADHAPAGQVSRGAAAHRGGPARRARAVPLGQASQRRRHHGHGRHRDGHQPHAAAARAARAGGRPPARPRRLWLPVASWWRRSASAPWWCGRGCGRPLAPRTPSPISSARGRPAWRDRTRRPSSSCGRRCDWLRGRTSPCSTSPSSC
jgi:serine/threonine protein kinase